MDVRQAEKWIDLEDWGTEMDENKLPPSEGLAGKQLEFLFQDAGQTTKCTFLDRESLLWETGHGQAVKRAYEAIAVSPEIYFIDIAAAGDINVSTSMVIDISTRKAMVITATLPLDRRIRDDFKERSGQGLDLSGIEVRFQHALINPSSPDEPVPVHERTSDLVGKRVQYTYSRNRVYEHIYLNDHFYTWHCLEGVEKGLADTEYCDYFKIAPDIYLFSWREKIMPTFGLVVINLKDMRSNGKTFGLDIGSGNYLNFSMGALAEFLNETKYR